MGSQAPGPIGQLVSGGQGGLSPETMEALRQMAAQNGGQLPPAQTMPTQPSPAPPQPPPQAGGIMDMLKRLFGMGQSAPPPPPPMLFSSQDAGQAAIDAQRKREQQQQPQR